ncbi:MAG: uroporphyrinogen decarboxylase family protein [Prolixibacteraceae bacterium]|jgi:MtaA/CmuA family methyltransferase|nr:uroporphyrinogen decarboxylase family protein [Prolixibacteraceae bacterium]
MTPFERYVGMLEGKKVDFVPRTPILMQFAAEFIGSNYACFASDFKTLVKSNEKCAKYFGVDQLSCISDPYRETHGFGSEVKYLKDAPPRSTHPLSENTDMGLLMDPNPLKSERMLDRVNAVKLYKEKFGDEYSVLGWVEGPAASAATLRDVSIFLMDLIIDEPFTCELMDRCLETCISFAKAQIDAGADTIGIGDAIASQVSPDIYENLILPREMKLIRAIKDMDAYVKLHICGNIAHLLPGISSLDIDILDVDHMVNLADVRAILPKRVAIAGNIDPVEGILRGTPESIRKRINDDYQLVGNPYLVNAGCEIPSGTPYENLKALCEPIRYRSE